MLNAFVVVYLKGAFVTGRSFFLCTPDKQRCLACQFNHARVAYKNPDGVSISSSDNPQDLSKETSAHGTKCYLCRAFFTLFDT